MLSLNHPESLSGNDRQAAEPFSFLAPSSFSALATHAAASVDIPHSHSHSHSPSASFSLAHSPLLPVAIAESGIAADSDASGDEIEEEIELNIRNNRGATASDSEMIEEEKNNESDNKADEILENSPNQSSLSLLHSNSNLQADSLSPAMYPLSNSPNSFQLSTPKLAIRQNSAILHHSGENHLRDLESMRKAATAAAAKLSNSAPPAPVESRSMNLTRGKKLRSAYSKLPRKSETASRKQEKLEKTEKPKLELKPAQSREQKQQKKKSIGRTEEENSPPPTAAPQTRASQESLPSGMFYVERLVDWGYSTVDGGLMYKVRWVGYGPEDDTWQARKILYEDAPEFVKDYEDRKGKRPLVVSKAILKDKSPIRTGKAKSNRKLSSKKRSKPQAIIVKPNQYNREGRADSIVSGPDDIESYESLGAAMENVERETRERLERNSNTAQKRKPLEPLIGDQKQNQNQSLTSSQPRNDQKRQRANQEIKPKSKMKRKIIDENEETEQQLDNNEERQLLALKRENPASGGAQINSSALRIVKDSSPSQSQSLSTHDSPLLFLESDRIRNELYSSSSTFSFVEFPLEVNITSEKMRKIEKSIRKLLTFED